MRYLGQDLEDWGNALMCIWAILVVNAFGLFIFIGCFFNSAFIIGSIFCVPMVVGVTTHLLECPLEFFQEVLEEKARRKEKLKTKLKESL